jgi:hypothetical protein
VLRPLEARLLQRTATVKITAMKYNNVMCKCLCNIQFAMSKCIACQHQRAQWREKANPKRTFCDKNCQWEYHYGRADAKLIGLKTAAVNDDDVIGLESSEGTPFSITRAEALQMKTVANLLEDAGPDNYIPLPLVDGRTLALVITFLTDRANFGEPRDAQSALDIIKAANYLEYEALIDYMLPRVVPILLAAIPRRESTDAAKAAFNEMLHQLRDLLPWIVFFMNSLQLLQYYRGTSTPIFVNMQMNYACT